MIDYESRLREECRNLSTEIELMKKREKGYLSELADYGRTVKTLREDLDTTKKQLFAAEQLVKSWMNNCDALHRKYSPAFAEESK